MWFSTDKYKAAQEGSQTANFRSYNLQNKEDKRE